MQAIDFLKEAIHNTGSQETLDALEKKYGLPLKAQAETLFSQLGDEIFFEDRYFAKLLSLAEVMDASEDMNVDFVELQIIPLIDTGDNDYIAYRLKTEDWCRFNIVDELAYDVKESIFDYYL